MNGHEQRLVAFLTYRPVPNHIPTPYITNQVSGYNVIGGSLSMVCRVNVDFNSAHIELHWGFPEKVDFEKVTIVLSLLYASVSPPCVRGALGFH